MSDNGTEKRLSFNTDALIQITTEEMQTFFQANREGDLATLAKTIARIAATCPPEWGEVNDPDTYLNRPWFGKGMYSGKWIVEQFTETLNSLKTDIGDKLTFELSEITGKQMAEFFRGMREMRLAELANTYAVVVTNCPKAWGKPDDSQTYLNRPFVEFKSVGQAFSEAVNEDQKK